MFFLLTLTISSAPPDQCHWRHDLLRSSLSVSEIKPDSATTALLRDLLSVLRAPQPRPSPSAPTLCFTWPQVPSALWRGWSNASSAIITHAYNPRAAVSFTSQRLSLIFSISLSTPHHPHSPPIGNSRFLSEISGHSFPHQSAVNGPALCGALGASPEPACILVIPNTNRKTYETSHHKCTDTLMTTG